MNRLLLAILFFGQASLLMAQTGLEKISFGGAKPRTSGETEMVELCFHAGVGNAKKKACNFERGYEDRSLDGTVTVLVEKICLTIHERATIHSDLWYLAATRAPADPLYSVDCGKKRAFRLDRPSTSSSQPAASSASSRTPQLSPVGKELERLANGVEGIDRRLKRIEGAAGLEGLRKGQVALTERLERLERELEQSRKAGRGRRCRRADGSYDGRTEVMVSVDGAVLRFLEIRPQDPSIAIGLAEETAREFLREAQQGQQEPIYPHLLLAVPEATREVGTFSLQDRLIDPGLFSGLSNGGDGRRVSHQAATRFIGRLNDACAGVARFALPTEEQLVAAAHLLYNPVENGLKPCAAVAAMGAEVGLAELLGNYWQLTSSPCQPFGADAVPSCDQGSYIRKGGSATSENPLECIPEYRSTAPPTVAQKETSFRLVLVE